MPVRFLPAQVRFAPDSAESIGSGLFAFSGERINLSLRLDVHAQTQIGLAGKDGSDSAFSETLQTKANCHLTI
jgi:hypothetical protein